MPLLDHFHPPLVDERRWETFNPVGPRRSRTHSPSAGCHQTTSPRNTPTSARLRRKGRDEVDVWRHPLLLGQPLPTLPQPGYTIGFHGYDIERSLQQLFTTFSPSGDTPGSKDGFRFTQPILQCFRRPRPDRRFGRRRSLSRSPLLCAVGNRSSNQHAQLCRPNMLFYLEPLRGTDTTSEVHLIIHPVAEETLLVMGQSHPRERTRHRCTPKKVDGCRAA